MNELTPVSPFTITITQSELGVMTSLLTADGVSAKESIVCGQQSLLASYVYRADGGYRLVYTVVGSTGQADSFAEEDGILPTLFLGPDGNNYVSIVPYHPDKEMEISVPVFQRAGLPPKPSRPFTGDYIGTTATQAIFYQQDWSGKKPDKILCIAFEQGKPGKKTMLKSPLAGNARVAVSSEQMHLLGKRDHRDVHVQLDAAAQIVRERFLPLEESDHLRVIDLSFERNSHLLVQQQDKLQMITVSIDGSMATTTLIDFPDPLFNTWQPVALAGDIAVTRFNTESGNGWITTRNAELLELFYSKGERGYRNVLNGQLLQIDRERLIIASANRTTAHGYAIVFYSLAEDGEKNRELLVLNRSVL